MRELDVERGGRTLRVRDAGDPQGTPILYFHATPGSRLDLAFADELAAGLGVRLVSFDRPGYGGSTPARFGLVSVARDAEAVMDELGIGRFATLGQSGGGPFSLAAGAVLGERVTRVGVAAGSGPLDRVPGALVALDDNDTDALALLPHDVEGAARGFAKGFEPLVTAWRQTEPRDIPAGFGSLMSAPDLDVLSDERLALALGLSLQEALRQGSAGPGWDNVAWVGPWEVEPATVTRPVHLWYGEQDGFVSPAHATWLRDNVPDATLVLRSGEGHLGFMAHTAELLSTLTQPAG
jgi:pimeloyl-ACP methyl ester carboxylesterase